MSTVVKKEVDGGQNRAQRKYQKRKQKQSEKKLLKKNDVVLDIALKEDHSLGYGLENGGNDSVEIEFVAPNVVDELDEEDPNYAEFADIFKKFDMLSQGISPYKQEGGEEEVKEKEVSMEDGAQDSMVAEPQEEESSEQVPKKLSKRQKRLARRLDVAELKGSVKRPDLVEIQDTTASDPFLLVGLKTYRNTIPVPRHWSQKRKYLQGKRGQEKLPFQLPEFIRNTGITDLRQAALDRADQQKLKAKQRERLRPKMGQLDVDYQVLHDAFFRYQTKPSLTRHGELYYEGKEFEPKTKDWIAGEVSDKLKKALGMPEGAPPPWLVNVQQHGPPPSYPSLRIPGVNAPIPVGAKYGFHAGGWGRAPIDMHGRPIWGWADAQLSDELALPTDYPKDFVWGALQYAEDYEDEGEETEETQMDVDGTVQPPTTAPRVPTEMEETTEIELRKFQEPGVAAAKDLYQVLPQQQTSVGRAAMGSSHTYAIPSSRKRVIDFLGSGGSKVGELEISLDPSDFELSEEQLRAKYERLFREHEREKLQPQGAALLTDADRAELQRRSAPKDNKPKDKKKDFVKF